MHPSDLSDREKKILFFVVDDFIQRGEPVASAAVVRSGVVEVSSATVRNVMSALEDSGFLLQPHTSAGRVPTTLAFRQYVDHLTNRQRILRHMQEQPAVPFDDLPEADAASIAQRASALLSRVSSLASFVLGPDLDRVRMREIRLVAVSSHRVLAVVVTSDGQVLERIVRLEQAVDPATLTRMQNYLAELAVGRTLKQVRERVRAELAEAETQYRDYIRQALAVGVHLTNVEQRASLHVEGVLNVLSYDEVANDARRMRDLLHALEEREKLVSILDQVCDASSPLAFIGPELAWDLGDDFSLLVCGFHREGAQVGVVGVLGPMRMNYARMIPLVDRAARMLSRELEEGSP